LVVASTDDGAGRGAAEAIARRAGTLTSEERRRLGRWASTTLRDPRTARPIGDARAHAQDVLSTNPDRKRHWQRVSSPLYEGLVAATAEDRRYRLVLLGGHFIAILAVVNVASGLPLPVAIPAVLAAPVSAWLAWGRATAWLGAIDASLGAELMRELSEDEVEVLQRAWRNSIEETPPVSPPLIGVISAFAPSAVLILALAVVAAMSQR
jgi:hypothetical protein